MKKHNDKKPKSQKSGPEKPGKKLLDPQEGNYFFYPNEYKDALCRIRIPGQARQILDVIERFTLGFNIKEAEISFKTFRARTGMADKHIIRARKILLKIKIIATPHKGSEKRVSYRIQMDYTKWKPLPIKGLPIKGVPKKGVKGTPHKGSVALPIKGVPLNLKDTYLKTYSLKTEKQIKIEQLKTRKKDLEEDLKNKGPGDNGQYLIEGIENINEQIKQLKKRGLKRWFKKKKND
ncbi:hypothetical protein ES703_76658 [subsurface metagenome]